MPEPVPAYLEYLREMARKIAYRGTFLNVLHRKPRRTPDRYLDWDRLPGTTELSNYLAAAEQDSRSQDGRTLFLGIGLLAGKLLTDGAATIVAAPLVMTPVELEPPHTVGDDVAYEPQWAATSLNYDLVTAILEGNDIVDPDDAVGLPNQVSPTAANTVNGIETGIEEIVRQAGASQRLLDPSFATQVASRLRRDVPAFRDKITDAPGRFRKPDLARIVSETRLLWFNHRFAFMGSMPDSLSAYEALNELCELRSRS